MKSSTNKSDTLTTAQKVVAIIVGILAILAFLGIKQISDLIPKPTPTPSIIDSMDSLSGWKELSCDSACGEQNGSSLIATSPVPGRTGNGNDHAIEISYNVKITGWVEIERDIYPSMLSKINGIHFYYRGDSGNAPNTIEAKLMLKYPDDTEETAFGVLLPGATSKSGWTYYPAPWSDFKCMFPDENCKKHKLDITYALKLSFAISNKPDYNDRAGSGKAAFDDVGGIQP